MIFSGFNIYFLRLEIWRNWDGGLREIEWLILNLDNEMRIPMKRCIINNRLRILFGYQNELRLMREMNNNEIIKNYSIIQILFSYFCII